MPCFSSGPEPETPEYDVWVSEVRPKLDSFRHVVDYYYRKAGLAMPVPVDDANELIDTVANERVLERILLHLDCDGVDEFHLNHVRNLLREDVTPAGRGYVRVLNHCFRALRQGFHDRPTTAETWEDCDHPRLMLDHLQGRISDRKLRLFAVACCRRVPHLWNKARKRLAVEVAERFADGNASSAEFDEAATQMRVREIRGHYGSVAAWVVADSADLAARNTAWNAFCDRNGTGEEKHQADLLRCVAGNPFRQSSFQPEWRTETVAAIAARMYESRDFSAMPILADAMEEAGCTDGRILTHCRKPGQHTRGCWVVDFVRDSNSG